MLLNTKHTLTALDTKKKTKQVATQQAEIAIGSTCKEFQLLIVVARLKVSEGRSYSKAYGFITVERFSLKADIFWEMGKEVSQVEWLFEIIFDCGDNAGQLKRYVLKL